jgi:hypothetical protein
MSNSELLEQRHSRRGAMMAAAAGLAGVAITSNANAAEPETVGKQDSAATPIDLKPFDQLRKEAAPDTALEPSASRGIESPVPAEFERNPEERAAFETVTKRLRTQLGLESTTDGGITFSSEEMQILHGFDFSPIQRDCSFLYLHIEPLIDQAADLLDRCLKERSNWDDSAAKMFNQLLELNEYADLDAIHRVEEREGIYDVPFKRSYAEANSEYFNNYFNEWLSQYVDTTISGYWTNAKINEVSGAAQLAGWLSGCVPYYFRSQSFDQYGQATWNGVTKDIKDHAHDSATIQAFHSLFSQFRSVLQQKWQFYSFQHSSGRRLPGLEAQYDWDFKNSSFQRWRTATARRYQDYKLRAATTADGILNYGKRLRGMRDRFHLDFRDAIARLQVLYRGLKEVYGYDVALPVNNDPVNYLDDCVLWVRSAIQALICFARREQGMALPISVRSACGERAWCAGLRTGRWKFKLDPTVFPSMAHVRLRGISATVAAQPCSRARVWRIKATPPPSARIFHLDNQVVTLDQSMLSPVLMGRAQDRNSNRDPDIVGASSLHNASPIGEWTVEVLGAVPHIGRHPGQLGAQLHDICIDLQIAYRAV